MADAGALDTAPSSAGQEHRTIDLAILSAQREFSEIVTDARNPGGERQQSYRYATLANVLSHVRPIINRHGLHLTSTPRMVEMSGQAMYIMETHLTHAKTGKARTAQFPICKGFLPPQTTGALMTYARRYTTLSLMGVAPEDSDDDAAEAQEHARDIDDAPPEIPNTFEVEPQISTGRRFLKGAEAKAAVNDLLRRMSEARDLDELERIQREAAKLYVSHNRLAALEEHYDRCCIAINAGEPLPAPPLFDEPAKSEDPAALYARLLLGLNRAKDKDALTAWADALTDEVQEKLSPELRSSLQSEYRRRAGATELELPTNALAEEARPLTKPESPAGAPSLFKE